MNDVFNMYAKQLVKHQQAVADLKNIIHWTNQWTRVTFTRDAETRTLRMHCESYLLMVNDLDIKVHVNDSIIKAIVKGIEKESFGIKLNDPEPLLDLDRWSK